jgi:NTE family protein
MYANQGTNLEARAGYVYGREFTLPGSTGLLRDTIKKNHEWLQFTIRYENYFKRIGPLRLGLLAEFQLSDQPFFNTYTATIAETPVFQPIPDMQTRFLEQYHATNYLGLGLRNIISFNKTFDLRIEAFVFQPYKPINLGKAYHAVEGEEFSRRYFIGSINPVYYSPVGPASISLNYYENQDNPVTLMFHLGYILFNKRALR